MSARLMRLACALALAFALVCAPGAWAVEGDEGQAGVAAASGDGAVDGESAANGEPADGATDDAPESAADDAPENAGEAGQGDEADPANAIDPQLLPDSSFIYDTSIVDLAQADSYFDNQTVRVTGEVVGDRRASLGDTENCWITLTEPVFGENSTVEVYMSNEQASRIDTYGAYGRVGTILSVQGTFHLVCAEHEGESDVHADSVTVSARGHAVQSDFDPQSFLPGIACVGVGVLMMAILGILRERGR